LSQIRDFAPLLLFEKTEQHFPANPDEFRQRSRFRHCRSAGRDRGWNNRASTWEEGSGSGPAFLNTGWETMLGQIARITERPVDQIQPAGRVTRPRDPRSLFGSAPDGFFMELEEGFGRDGSGGGHLQPLPIFCDLYDVEDNDGRPWRALAYWFFYIYNWNYFFAHEGDWEHITLYFTPSEFEQGSAPRLVYYAAHNHGAALPWDRVRKAESTHPTKGEIRLLEDCGWHRYDGAWGEVGQFAHSTGPLGPWFKRKRDHVRLKRTYL
jgi:hypothetical protein